MNLHQIDLVVQCDNSKFAHFDRKRGYLTQRVASGFTLSELLVVVAVIMVLLSLLVPVIGSIRRQSMLVACASNLRQWGVVVHSYATDNRGQIPESAPDWQTLSAAGRTYWGVLKVQQAAHPAWISYPVIQPYFSDDSLTTLALPRFWCCPVTRNFIDAQVPANPNVLWTSYVYMAGVSSWAGLASDPSRFQDRRLTAEGILMSDRLLWTNSAWYANHPHFEFVPTWDASWEPNLRLNQLFGDGHCSTRKGSDLPLSAMTGGAAVGLYADDGGGVGNKAYF